MSVQWLRTTHSLSLRQVPRCPGHITQHCHISQYAVSAHLLLWYLTNANITARQSTLPSPPPRLRPSECKPLVYDYSRALFVSTLDLKRLSSSDYHVLPQRPVLGLSPETPRRDTEEVSSVDYANSLKQPHQSPYVSFLAYGPKEGDIPVRFPPDQRGFFYYHSGSTSSPYAGQLRFRVTQSADPGSWTTGSDFLQPNGMPWNKNLFAIATQHPKLTAIREALLADGLITPELVERCRQVWDWRRELGPNLPLTSLRQPFVVKFQALDRGQFAVVGREEQEFVRIEALFRDLRRKRDHSSPYRGKEIVMTMQHRMLTDCS